MRIALPSSIGVGLGLGAAALAALIVAGVWISRNRELFNPGSAQNIAHQAASSIVAGATGGAAAGGEDSVGGVLARIREWVSGDDAAIEAMKRGTPLLGVDRVEPSTLGFTGA